MPYIPPMTTVQTVQVVKSPALSPMVPLPPIGGLPTVISPHTQNLTSPGTIDYERHSQPELLVLVQNFYGIQLDPNMKKADIINWVRVKEAMGHRVPQVPNQVQVVTVPTGVLPQMPIVTPTAIPVVTNPFMALTPLPIGLTSPRSPIPLTLTPVVAVQSPLSPRAGNTFPAITTPLPPLPGINMQIKPVCHLKFRFPFEGGNVGTQGTNIAVNIPLQAGDREDINNTSPNVQIPPIAVVNVPLSPPIEVVLPPATANIVSPMG
ncbi:unnamed protein product, partial [marine sediment metagenome]